jgi:hypothetical protein
LREINNEEEYESELANCVGVTGFHRWFFLKALSESLGIRMRVFAVESSGRVIGVLPILLRKRGPLSTANYLPVPHVGPLVRDMARLPDVLTAAEPFLLRQLTVVTKWAFAPGLPVPAEPLARAGFQVSTDENFFVPAGRSPADHLAAMPRGNRREVALSQSRGLKVTAADVPAIRDWFADRVDNPYRRQGTTPDYSRAAARRLVDLLGEDQRMLWRAVHDDQGQLLAVGANIIDTERVWTWLLVGEHNARPSPHVAAYWDVLEWSLGHGLACDFGGAPNPGIRKFKLRMGGEAGAYLVAERVRPDSYRKLRSLYAGLSARRSGTAGPDTTTQLPALPADVAAAAAAGDFQLGQLGLGHASGGQLLVIQRELVAVGARPALHGRAGRATARTAVSRTSARAPSVVPGDAVGDDHVAALPPASPVRPRARPHILDDDPPGGQQPVVLPRVLVDDMQAPRVVIVRAEDLRHDVAESLLNEGVEDEHRAGLRGNRPVAGVGFLDLHPAGPHLPAGPRQVTPG